MILSGVKQRFRTCLKFTEILRSQLGSLQNFIPFTNLAITMAFKRGRQTFTWCYLESGPWTAPMTLTLKAGVSHRPWPTAASCGSGAASWFKQHLCVSPHHSKCGKHRIIFEIATAQ